MTEPLSLKNLNNIFRTSKRDPSRIVNREGTKMEFKESYNHGNMAQYFKTMAAFANNSGGHIIFGVGDNPRRLVGLKDKSLAQFEGLKVEDLTKYLWKEGRSAMEVAKSWFRQSVSAPPKEIVQLLFNHFQQNIEFIKVVPELVTPLPESGGMRNHDVACTCMIGKSKATVCIEGKTDESFGEKTVAQYYQQMKNRRRAGVSTRVPERIEKMVSMLPIPPAEVPSCAVADNGYQLVTALVGTALQARIDHSELAILIIHEFHTDGLDPQKIQKNIQDYSRFVNKLTGNTCADGANGKLFGPIEVDGVACFIGRVVV